MRIEGVRKEDSRGHVMEHINNSLPNILIVDDVSTNLLVLTEMIRNLGYSARPVSSAKQANSVIDSVVPNLILLDVAMPEVDGFEFCTQLKRNPATRDIPVIFISALNQKEYRMRGLELGAVDYITKPFDVEEVTLRIKTHMKIHMMQQEQELHNRKLHLIINEQTRKSYEEQKRVLQGIVRLSLKKDEGKQKRIERISANCRLLAMGMQLSPLYKDIITNSFIDFIEPAAMAHDIGMIGIPDYIIKNVAECNTGHREGHSSEEEKYYQSHTELGAESLRDMFSYNEHSELIKMSIEMALNHHEAWDGTGFPMGLQGTRIPLSARIIAVAIAFDVELTHQKNSNAETRQKDAVKYVNICAGKKLDSDIVQILNRIQNQLKI